MPARDQEGHGTGGRPCTPLLPKKVAESRSGADFGAPAPKATSLARVTCVLWLSHGGASHQPHFERDFLFISFLSWGSGWLPVVVTERRCFGSPVLSKGCPKPPVCWQQQAAGGASWGCGCLAIGTALPAPSTRDDAGFVLTVVWGMNFGGLLFCYFLGALAQGNVTP